ncbi:MAG: FkbM family methyltransferase [Bacteroidales bacterium]
MKLRSLDYLFINHPLNKDRKLKSIFLYIKWIINTLVNSKPVIHSFTEKTKLIVYKNSYGASGNLICGLLEYNEMLFLLHFLRKEDLFIDVGANIGSYTILSAAHIEADTISVEPYPPAFDKLIENIHINNSQSRVKALLNSSHKCNFLVKQI